MDNDKVEKSKIITITKEEGKKWAIEFNGRVSRRDLNQVRRLLPVEYARMGRRRQRDRLQKERMDRLEVNKVLDVQTTENVSLVKTTEIKPEESSDG